MKRVQQTAFPKDAYISTITVVAQAIKAARTQAGMRIVDAALVANVSIQTLVDVEAGRPGVSLGKVLQIADALGVSFFAVPATSRDRIRNVMSHENASIDDITISSKI